MTSSDSQVAINKGTIGTALATRAVESDYFQELVADLEETNSRRFINAGNPADVLIDDDKVTASLRFADLLSHSESSTHREISYKLIALLHELASWQLINETHYESLIGITESVLIELGNFPAIQTLRRVTDYELSPPPSKQVTKTIKALTHKTQHGDSVFTDAQATVVQGLQGASFFSFSGPTSLGKSFIIKDTLFGIVTETEMSQRAIVVLVPTRALITQTINDLRQLFSAVHDVHISQHPRLSPYLREQYSRTIFVFTPERLLNYLNQATRQINYLFVDEAQKVIADGDTRSPLYYHSINETIRKFATKVAFASPNISNPDIFLQLFQKSVEGSLAISERTVTQHRYFIDLVNSSGFYYPDILTAGPIELTIPQWDTSFNVIRGLARGNQSIVYINSVSKVVLEAIEFARSLPERDDPKLSELASYVREHVHKDYFLIDCLTRGIAFHHGRMPQELRERIEELFAMPDSPLQYVFCTSTLLEGVNLPAKNIFVLSDQRGLSNLSPLDFENLIGRAGRLTYDFAGNVVCVRETPKRWAGKTRTMIQSTKPTKVESFLVNPAPTRRKELEDIEKMLIDEPIKAKRTFDSKKISQQYASILTLHELDGQSSSLKTLFLNRISNAKTTLEDVSKHLTLPADILRNTPDIAAKYQEKIWRETNNQNNFAPLVPEHADLNRNQTYFDVLIRLYDTYEWNIHESRGYYTLTPKPTASQEATYSRLRYWANLMRNWVTGKPLNLIIKSAINYFKNEGKIGIRDYSTPTTFRTVPFVETDSHLINIVIEDTLQDIEVGLRFRIARYLQNFYQISSRAVGVDMSGIDLANIVEYGTDNAVAIALQDVGMSRSGSINLADDFSEWIVLTPERELADIALSEILTVLQTDSDLYEEVSMVFGEGTSNES